AEAGAQGSGRLQAESLRSPYVLRRGYQVNPQASRTSCRYANPLAGGNTCGPAKPVPRCFWNRESLVLSSVVLSTSIAIVAAMHEELSALLARMPDEQRVRVAGRDFWVGHLQGQPVV